MKIEIKVKKEVEIKYLKVRAGVRYWEDAEVNGVTISESGKEMPCKQGDDWSLLIDIETGVILNWEEGKTADVHFKVCDDGDYYLLDENHEVVLHREGYVPDILDLDGESYGDYIIMEINEDGLISNWDNEASIKDFFKKED